MSHPGLPAVCWLACPLLVLAACSSPSPASETSRRPERSVDASTPPQPPHSTESQPCPPLFAELAALARERSTELKGDTVFFRTEAWGQNKEEAKARAESLALGSASQTRKSQVRSYAELRQHSTDGPGGAEDSSESTLLNTVESNAIFRESSVERHDYCPDAKGFRAIVEIAIPREQVYPFGAMEGRGHADLMDLARRFQSNGDTAWELRAYEQALAMAPGPEREKETIRILADRLAELGEPEGAAALLHRHLERSPEWTRETALAMAQRRVDELRSSRDFDLAVREVEIWRRFDSKWAEELRSELLLLLDTPEVLFRELQALVQVTEPDPDNNNYYCPQDRSLYVAPIGKTAFQQSVVRVRLRLPEGKHSAMFWLDEGEFRFLTARPETDLTHSPESYRPGRAHLIIFVAETSDSLPVLEDEAISRFELEGQTHEALSRRKALRRFVNNTKGRLSSEVLNALHLTWEQR